MTTHQLTARIAVVELELSAKGYSPDDVAAAARYALRVAQGLSSHCRPEIREQAFGDLLDHQLRGAEAWLAGVAAARARGDYRKGMERAARDDRYRAQLERFLGHRTTRGKAWTASLDQAARAWERT